jgi:hypothetical protein
MKGRITRKEFLASTTKTVAAVSAGMVAGSVISASGGQSRQAGITNAALAPWPWPYARLDREDVRKRAHKNYYDGGCCYGAFNALISALVDAVGEPYTRMPTQMMYFGGGGGAGWGTLCGALNGSAAAINLVVDRTNANLVISELFGWYTQFPFPSAISNDYASQRVFLVNRNDKVLKQTVAGSTLCHPSVSLWCSESGFKTTSGERTERCARLTADVAARAVELLNEFFTGRFRATFVAPESVTGCMGCHSSGQGNVQATVKMDCQQCHKENFDHLY